MVPGEPVAATPPVVAGAQWVLNPGPPGSPGPIWCLEPVVASAPLAPLPPQYGWIRVLCDTDATPARITGIQRRLYEHGLYRGAFTGHYDASTAAAVAQFQTGAHLAHGGYLSIETVQALEANASVAAAPLPPLDGGYAYQASGYGAPASPCQQACAFAPPPVTYAPPPPVYIQPQVYAQAPVYAQPVYAAPNCGCYGAPPPPPPCCAAVQTYGYVGSSYGYGQATYGVSYGPGYGYVGSPAPAYAAASARASASAGGGYASAQASASASVVQNGWLTWGGMSRY